MGGSDGFWGSPQNFSGSIMELGGVNAWSSGVQHPDETRLRGFSDLACVERVVMKDVVLWYGTAS